MAVCWSEPNQSPRCGRPIYADAMNRALGVVALITVAAVVLYFSYDSLNGSRDSGGYDEDSIEYELALLDSDQQLSTSDPTIDRYDDLLDELQSKCGDDRRLIGDMARGSTGLLAEHGVTATSLQMLEGAVDALRPLDYVQDSCSEVFSVLILLMSR